VRWGGHLSNDDSAKASILGLEDDLQKDMEEICAGLTFSLGKWKEFSYSAEDAIVVQTIGAEPQEKC
jgi:hypothetical protein